MPEFLVIAVVALVVLGPEQLRETMRIAGRLYRQFRELTTTYQAEARRFLEEGMREVEEVSSTLTTTWQEATAPAPAGPPPRLLQVAPLLQAPDTVADAGPWALAAWHRETAPEVEPYAADSRPAPFVLPHRPLETGWLGTAWAGLGGPVLMAPAPDEAELAALDALLAEAPEEPRPSGLAGSPDVAAAAPPRAAALGEEGPVPVPAGEIAEPEREPGTNGAAARRARVAPEAPAGAAPSPQLGAREGQAVAAPLVRHELGERERTVVELYRKGYLTLEQAAETLQTTPLAFRRRLREL